MDLIKLFSLSINPFTTPQVFTGQDVGWGYLLPFLLGPRLILHVAKFPFLESSCLTTTIFPCQYFSCSHSVLLTLLSSKVTLCASSFLTLHGLVFSWTFSHHNIWPNKTHLRQNKSRCWNTALPLIFLSSSPTFLKHWLHFESNCFWVLFREKSGWFAFSSLFLRVCKSSAWVLGSQSKGTSASLGFRYNCVALYVLSAQRYLCYLWIRYNNVSLWKSAFHSTTSVFIGIYFSINVKV